MARSAADHLRDILEAVEAIARYTGAGQAAFDREPMVRDAVCARLIQIGQAVKDAQAEGLELQSLQREIPWRSITGLRDRLARKYATLDKALIWAVVEHDLPRLRDAVNALLSRR